MKIENTQGNTKKGTITYILSKLETGLQGSIAFCDYYNTEKNRYLLEIFISQKGSEEVLCIFSNDIDSTYTELKYYCKEIIQQIIQNKKMKDYFKAYTEQVNSFGRLVVKSKKTMFIIIEKEDARYLISNGEEICKDMNRELETTRANGLDIWGNIVYWIEKEKTEIRSILSGEPEDITEFLRHYREKEKQWYDVVTTDAGSYIDMEIKFKGEDRNYSVMLRLKEGHGLITREIKSYFEHEASSVEIINCNFDWLIASENEIAVGL